MEKKICDTYVEILRQELVPALGCTEPIAIAYACAKAREVLGCFPQAMEVWCSGNIIKNVKGVTVPRSGGMRGVEAAALLGPYLAAVAARREDRMMLAALALEKPPRRTLLGMLGVLQAALRDAVFAAEGLPQAPLQPALQEQTRALARAVPAGRLLRVYDFVEELIDRVSRNAAGAAVTCALTGDVYRICFL